MKPPKIRGARLILFLDGTASDLADIVRDITADIGKPLRHDSMRKVVLRGVDLETPRMAELRLRDEAREAP